LVAAGLLPDEEENNMALKMTNREGNGVSVVALDGRIVIGEESNSLREKLKSLIADGKKKIVLNMDNIKYIDSTGLETLVAAHCSTKNPWRIAAPVPSRRQVPGSAADHQAADGIRGLRYGSSRCRQFLKLSVISAPERVMANIYKWFRDWLSE
jgi:anti-anti-sigma factor